MSITELPRELLDDIIGRIKNPTSAGALAQTNTFGRKIIADGFHPMFDVIQFDMEQGHVTFLDVSITNQHHICKIAPGSPPFEFVAYYAAMVTDSIAVTLPPTCKFPWAALRGKKVSIHIVNEPPVNTVWSSSSLPPWAVDLEGSGMHNIAFYATIESLCVLRKCGYSPNLWAASRSLFPSINAILDDIEQATAGISEIIVHEAQDLYAINCLGDTSKLLTASVCLSVSLMPRMYIQSLTTLGIIIMGKELDVFETVGIDTQIHECLWEIGAARLTTVRVSFIVPQNWVSDRLVIDLTEFHRAHRFLEKIVLTICIERRPPITTVWLVGNPSNFSKGVEVTAMAGGRFIGILTEWVPSLSDVL